MFHIYIHFNSDFNKNYHIGKHKKTLDRKIKKKNSLGSWAAGHTSVISFYFEYINLTFMFY